MKKTFVVTIHFDCCLQRTYYLMITGKAEANRYALYLRSQWHHVYVEDEGRDETLARELPFNEETVVDFGFRLE